MSITPILNNCLKTKLTVEGKCKIKHHILSKAFHFFGNSFKTHMTNRNRKYVRLNAIDYFHLDGGPALWRVRLDAGVLVCCLPLLWVFVSTLID